MIKKVLEKSNSNIPSRILPQNFIGKGLLLLLSVVLLSSCTDQGCIEADDFGEYQSQTLTVSANAAENACNYDSKLSLFDTAQGNGIKDCLTKGSQVVVDGNGDTQKTGEKGCAGNQVDPNTNADLGKPLDSSFLTICTSLCVQSCLSGSSAGANGQAAEPNWKSTDKRDVSQNFGIQILPGAQININATGSITLGGSAVYPNLYLPVDKLSSDSIWSGTQPNYQNSDWTSPSVFDVKNGQALTVNFSGAFSRSYSSSPPYLYSSSQIGAGSSVPGSNSITNTQIYAGGRSLVVYTIPQPAGYSFDNSQSTEIAGTKGTPLLPDPKAWTCDYTGAWTATDEYTQDTNVATSQQSNCYNIAKGYQNLGYASSVDSAVLNNSDFIIRSSSKSDGLGTYGGPIRWAQDNTIDGSHQVFRDLIYKGINVISSSEYAIPAGSTFDSNGVPIVPGINPISITSSGVSFTNNDADPYMLYLQDNSSCSSSTTSYATIKDSSGNNIPAKTNILIANNWAQSTVTIDPGQKLVITPDSKCTDSNNTLNAAIKFQKFKDIKIERSGFIRFTTLNASSGACTLNGRIINPQDSGGNVRSNADSDFYEYDDFTSTSSKDPLNALSVPNSTSSLYSWSNSVFVRKGQTIRLSPQSWNGTITTANGLKRQCGIGMVMQITPRPALLCKGHASEALQTLNPECVPHFNDSGVIDGCQAISSKCSDSSNTANSYCPYIANDANGNNIGCVSTITCNYNSSTTTGTCSSATPQSTTVNSSACNTLLSSVSNQSAAKTQCTNCYNTMLANGQLQANNSIDIDQCYDLENYTGRVSDIPVASGTMVATSDPMFSKGADKLTTFNGSYGNLELFRDAKTVDSKKSEIYQTLTPITFNSNSRVKVMTLTNNNDFSDLYSNYSTSNSGSTPLTYSGTLTASGGSYSGSNGFLLTFSGPLQFTNGQWLEVMLCRDDSTNSCSSLTLSQAAIGSSELSALSAQPHLVEISDATGSSGSNPILKSTSGYSFDAFGTLTRTAASGYLISGTSAADCTNAKQGVETTVGSNFYCHTYLKASKTYTYDASSSTPFSDSDYEELNKLRLSFKIKDPEIANCNISDPTKTSSFDGIQLTNPGYQNNCKTTGSNVYNGYINSSGTCVSNSANTGYMCGANEVAAVTVSTGQTKCYKQFYCANKYVNNSGEYQVAIRVSNPPGSNISNIISGVITPVIEVMDGVQTINPDGSISRTQGQSERIYTAIVNDSRYQAILSVCLVVMFSFYGMTYLMGITELSSSDLINRAIKISLIYFFASPGGWYWFNLIVVNWFKNGTDYLAFMMASSFDDSTVLKQAIANGNYYDKSVLFSSVDEVFGMFFSQAVQKKISALLFASIFGWLYLMIIYWAFMLYVYSVANAVLYYLTAQIFISLLFTLGPLFFIFTLFNQTKGMFDSWLNQIIGFALQQILLLTTLAFFNMMMYEVLKMSLGYKICWDEVWSINIITRISLLSFWTIASMPSRLNTQLDVGNIGHPDGIPSLFSILFIWLIASLMNEFITFMTDLGATIGGSVKASGMASGVKAIANGMHAFATQQANKLSDKTFGQVADRLDNYLFDSGKTAKENRQARRDQNAKDQGNKSQLNKAGNDAMSKFKRENADQLIGKSEEEKKQLLSDVRDKAIAQKGKDLGLEPKDIERLKSDKGLKYEGSNLTLAGLQALKQGAGFGGGTLNKSIKDQKIDTSLSFGQAKDAMKHMNAEEKGKFMKAAEDGDIKVKDSKISKAMSDSKKLAKGVGTDLALAASGFSGLLVVGGAAAAGHKGSQDFLKGSATYKASKELAKGASKLYGKGKSAAGFGKYGEAVKNLQDSGKINRMAYGTNFARPKAESDMINKEMKNIKESSKAKKSSATSASTLANLKSVSEGIEADKKSLEKQPIVTAISSAIFGAGGLSHAVRENLGGGISQKTNDSRTVEGQIKLSQTSKQLAETNTQKDKAETTMNAAQKASQDIKKMNALDKKEKTATPQEKAQIAIERSDLIASSRYFQEANEMSKLREQQSDPNATATEKLAGLKQMQEIMGKDGYIESTGKKGGLENANSTYQTASQNFTNLSKKSEDLSKTVNSMSASQQIFEQAMAAEPAINQRRSEGSFMERNFGTAESNTLKEMKKDYSKLQKASANSAAKEHSKFAERYKDFNPQSYTNPNLSNSSSVGQTQSNAKSKTTIIQPLTISSGNGASQQTISQASMDFREMNNLNEKEKTATTKEEKEKITADKSALKANSKFFQDSDQIEKLYSKQNSLQTSDADRISGIREMQDIMKSPEYVNIYFANNPNPLATSTVVGLIKEADLSTDENALAASRKIFRTNQKSNSDPFN